MSRLTIVGASVRAAAASARRSGFTPWCADLFADADLRASVPHAIRCPAGLYPHALLDILRDSPAAPWIYTGGLENHPNLIRRLAELRPLWGNGPNALLACRSPFTVERILREEGLQVPEARAADAELPGYCRWLRKPLAGAGGRGLTFADGCRRTSPAKAGHFYQQFVPGPSMSAIFVRARGDVRLLGVTEQLIGTDWLDAPPFRYAGNIGPILQPENVRHDLLRVGLVLGEQCELLGLFGVDFVLHESRPWVIEVNPRYPASVEVLELATGVGALALHAAAFDPAAGLATAAAPGEPTFGKGILYARSRLVITEDVSRALLDVASDAMKWFADVPSATEVIEPGWPIFTVMAAGATPEACRAILAERTRWARGLLGIGLVTPRPRSWYDRLDDPDAD